MQWNLKCGQKLERFGALLTPSYKHILAEAKFSRLIEENILQSPSIINRYEFKYNSLRLAEIKFTLIEEMYECEY
jgi:hypothetical protein